MTRRFRLHAFNVAVLAAATFVLAGCGGAPPLHPPKPLPSAPNTGYAMQTVWSADIGDGPGQGVTGLRIAVADNTAYTAGMSGLVSAHSVASGDTIWATELDASLAAGPAVGSGVVVVATRDGGLRAVSAANGEPLWQQNLSSAIIAAPTIANGKVVVHTLDGSIVALTAKTGVRQWTVQSAKPRLTIRGTARPIVDGGVVYVGMATGKVKALQLADGSEVWTRTVAFPTGQTELEQLVDVDADVLVKPNVVYAVSVGDRLAAMSRAGGDILWRQQISSSLNLAADNKRLYTVNPDGIVFALARNNGSTRWQNDAFKYRRLSAPALYRGGVVVGDYAGYLHWLAADGGREIARGQPLDGAVIGLAVVGDNLLVLGADGTLVAVRFGAG